MVKIHFLGRKIAKRRFQPFLPTKRNLNRVRSANFPVVLGLVQRFRLLAVGNSSWKLSSFALRIEQQIF